MNRTRLNIPVKNMKQKITPPEDPDANKRFLFCTECGEKLDDFCFTDDAANIESVRRHHQGCKKTGKFKGEMCSRLFIASDDPGVIPEPME
jgi:hypothetical protein